MRYFSEFVRYKVRQALAGDLARMLAGGVEGQQERMRKFLDEIRAMPIAINQTDANDQHYEV